jgi:hypothetical protein
MAYGTVNADVISTSVANTSLGAGNATRFKNRIINGDMTIDQRNAGASVTIPATDTYSVDRWFGGASVASKYSLQQSTVVPAGFKNSLLATVLSAYSTSGDQFRLEQRIEGLNIADLGWGTANAKTVTISFWARSSVTGTFGGAIVNSPATRSYPFTYTINSVNTWEYETITIAGDTSGTWLTTNGAGICIRFNIGSGSSWAGTANTWQAGDLITATGASTLLSNAGATLYITGVQLEVGTSATGFEYVDYTTQLMMCQRYLFKANDGQNTGGVAATTGQTQVRTPFAVPMRTAPTCTYSSGTWGISDDYTANITANPPTILAPDVNANGGRVYTGGFSGLTVGRFYASAVATGTASLFYSAEL